MPAEQSTAALPELKRFLKFIIQEAEHQAALVSAFFRAVNQVYRIECEPKDWNLTRNEICKIASYMRIRQWEVSGIWSTMSASIPPNLTLPSAMHVLEDLLRSPEVDERFNGDRLARTVTFAAWTYLIWRSHPESKGEFVVQVQSSPEDLVNVMAGFLWRCRHLSISKG